MAARKSWAEKAVHKSARDHGTSAPLSMILVSGSVGQDTKSMLLACPRCPKTMSVRPKPTKRDPDDQAYLDFRATVPDPYDLRTQYPSIGL